MTNLLETLNDCLQNVTVHKKYAEYDCHISLTDGGNHTIYIRISASGDLEKTCVATPRLPVNKTRFTRISLDGKCDLKKSLNIPKIPEPFTQ